MASDDSQIKATSTQTRGHSLVNVIRESLGGLCKLLNDGLEKGFTTDFSITLKDGKYVVTTLKVTYTEQIVSEEHGK